MTINFKTKFERDKFFVASLYHLLPFLEATTKAFVVHLRPIMRKFLNFEESQLVFYEYRKHSFTSSLNSVMTNCVDDGPNKDGLLWRRGQFPKSIPLSIYLNSIAPVWCRTSKFTLHQHLPANRSSLHHKPKFAR